MPDDAVPLIKVMYPDGKGGWIIIDTDKNPPPPGQPPPDAPPAPSPKMFSMVIDWGEAKRAGYDVPPGAVPEEESWVPMALTVGFVALGLGVFVYAARRS